MESAVMESAMRQMVVYGCMGVRVFSSQLPYLYAFHFRLVDSQNRGFSRSFRNFHNNNNINNEACSSVCCAVIQRLVDKEGEYNDR